MENSEQTRMKYRKLRIAWTLACGIASVMLIALWMRSYWSWDQIDCWQSKDRAIVSVRGSIKFCSIQYASFQGTRDWQFTTGPVATRKTPADSSLLGFYLQRLGNGSYIFIPDWSVTLVAVALSAAPWMRLRFSLCTLLIATTLIAFALGLIVWLR